MARCPTLADPPATITDRLNVYTTFGENDDHEGDYTVAGAGTRNFGTGVIRLKSIPPKTTISKVYLIYNTYESNNVTAPNVLLNGMVASGTLYGICGSTCWLNPGNELTTYLRNRVYVTDVTAIVKGNGNYTITGLPVDLSMPIGTDGDRVPGCLSSQGAVLLVLWQWNEGEGLNQTFRFRGVQVYLGAKLLTPNPAVWTGSPSYNLPFVPAYNTTQMVYYKGNANITAVAGDTQNSLIGKRFAVNQVQFLPPNNAFSKLAPSISVKKYSIASIYDGMNSAFASTVGDCYDWFLFVVSGDKTDPKAQFQIVNCAATSLKRRAEPTDTQIVVNSNYVQPCQTVAGDGDPGCNCRAAAYNQLADPPLANPPGMFPAAPYYIYIDKEIMKVTAKSNTFINDPNNGGMDHDYFPDITIEPQGVPDPIVWTVERGQSGTTPAEHQERACVYLLAPVKFIADMQSGLKPKGQPAQRPSPGRPKGRFRK